MFSVASLLNPDPKEPRGTRLPSSPSSSLRASPSAHGSPQPSTQSCIKKQKMIKDGAIFAKGKIKGDVNYPPFERMDEETMRAVQKFQVYPLGKIQDYCRHIPYNSEKKSFLEKTGRESFEVFQYTFKVLGDDKEYCVMWDYNIGLVRITPFFKCCKYSKTTPAKMLNMNPGLKEITHSITGGALAAQGYWMPYECALEVCTTFCSHIAPALIPIFGLSFPSRCVPVEAPEHGRMIIDPQTIQEATKQAENYRIHYKNRNSSSKSSSRESYSPQRPVRQPPRTHIYREKEGYNTQPLSRRLRLKRAFRGESPYETNTDMDIDETSNGEGGYFHSNSSITPISSSLASRPRNWGYPQAQHDSHNHSMLAHNTNSSIKMAVPSQYKCPNPLLSAIPRSTGVVDMQMVISSAHRGNAWPMHGMHVNIPPLNLDHTTPGYSSSGNINTRKRRIVVLETDEDRDYDGSEESGSLTCTDDKISVDGSKASELATEREDVSIAGSTDADASVIGESGGSGGGATSVAGSTLSSGSGGAEKKAAWLLMKLSVKDGECGVGAGFGASAGTGTGNFAGGGLHAHCEQNGTEGKFKATCERVGLGTCFRSGIRPGLTSGGFQPGIGYDGGHATAVATVGLLGVEEDGPRIKRKRATSM